MKEKIRKLLTEHERLYWLIVIGASILALVLSTMLLSKTESAHAAETTDGAYYPSLWEVNWGEYEDELEAAVNQCDMFWVNCVVSDEFLTYTYCFIDSSLYDSPAYVWSGVGDYKLTYTYFFEVRGEYMDCTRYGDACGAVQTISIADKNENNCSCLGTNFDLVGAPSGVQINQNNLTYPVLGGETTDRVITVTVADVAYKIPLEGRQYYAVFYQENGMVRTFITNKPLKVSSNSSGVTVRISKEAGNCLTYGCYGGDADYRKTRFYFDSLGVGVGRPVRYESNYDLYDEDTGELMYSANFSPSGAEVTYTYLVNAPYIVFDALKIDNPTINGQEVCTDMTQYDWKYRGHLSGQSLDATSYELQHKMYVRLPSKEYINKFMDETLDVLVYAFFKDAYLEDIVELINDWNEDCKSNKSAYDTYAIEFVERYSDLEMSHLWNKNAPIISRDAEHIYSAICEQYESFWYDVWLKDIEEDGSWDDFEEKSRAIEKKIITAFVWSCMYVERVDSVLYTTTSDAIYYGRMVSNHFDFGVINYCVTVETLEDYMNDDSNEEQYQKQLEQAYKEALAKSEAEKDSLQSNIDNIYHGTNAYSDLSSSDIWDYAKSTASGLVGSLNWIKKLGAVVASVFSFIPGVNENIIVPVFVIGIITAIIAFIRGK